MRRLLRTYTALTAWLGTSGTGLLALLLERNL